MPLIPGVRLGVYEIVSAIGAGGMGEVYRARDTRLDRDVAIKVLPKLFATDPERLARFDREARTLASINHPNIAQIYGVVDGPAEEGAHVALVMELVEGEDLAARLARGPLPLSDALLLARQLAEALEAAHESGIIHRDLKPANVKVRPDGTVKVLDFGLAKALDPAALSTTDPMQSPTLTARATQLGMVIGTAAYMSPEQARGKAVDRRADIWAFGCVLYEMLTGRRPFSGDDVTDTLTAALRDPPDWANLPEGTPESIRSLLARCLEKDPKQRLRDIGEARILLAGPGGSTSAPALAGAAPVAARPAPGRRLSWPIAAVVMAVLAAMAGYVARPEPERRVQKTSVAIQRDGSVIRFPVISPDGRKIAYESRSRLWVQSLDEWEPRELPGTEGGVRPFWSPAGDWIVFFRSEQLLKVPAAGGPVVSVANLPAVQAPLNSSSGVWTDDGTLIISLASGPSVYRVPSGGGELKEHFRLPAEIGLDLRSLASLPGGALVAAVNRTSGVDAIGVYSKGTFNIVLEVTNVRRPRYSPSGHLVFVREAPNAGLWAVPFSVDRLQVTGEPFLIGRGTEPSLARDGTLLFLGAPDTLARQLAWFTMDGRLGTVIAPPQDWIEGVKLSPDERTLLASASDGIWNYDVATGARSRVTTGRSDITPQWIGSGRMVFVRTNSGRPDLMVKPVTPGSDEQPLAQNARFPTVTADGRRVVFNQQVERSWQVAWLDVEKPSEIHTLDPAHLGARFPAVSPDGRLVAYVSGEIGRDEIFLTRFPSGEGKWQLSSDGGGWCRFSGRGDAVVYRAPNGDFMSVPISVGDDVKIGRPLRLFEWGAGWMAFYELARDGARGITAVPVGRTAGTTSLSLVQNWHLEFSGR